MNQLIVNNSNPSKLYIGQGESASAFLSGQAVFPSVSGSVTFAGNAIPADQDLSADETSVNLSVVFSYDTRNSLAVVLQKEDSSSVMQDVGTVSVTDTRFSGWDSINAAVNVSQDVPANETPNTYRFKFTETVDGTDVTTLSSLMIVRREPELTVTLSPSGDQTIQPGEDITLTPTLTVVGIPASSLSSVNWRWTVRKGENTYASDLVTDLNDPDYTVDSGTGALTITGNLSKARKNFTLVANVSDESQGASGKLYTAHVYVSVTASDTVGGYKMVWERVGVPFPITERHKQQHPLFYGEFAEPEFLKENGDGGLLRDLRMKELSNGNFRMSYFVQNPKRDEPVKFTSFNTSLIENPSAAFFITEITPSGSVVSKNLVRHDMWTQASHSTINMVSYVIDDEATALCYGSGRYRLSDYGGGGYGQYFIEDQFLSGSSSNPKWTFNAQTQSSSQSYYSYPRATRLIKAGSPSRIYVFLEHNKFTGGSQIIRTETAPLTSEVCNINPYGTGKGIHKVSDDLNWVVASKFNKFGSETSFLNFRMVKTNFLTGALENGPDNHILTDGLPGPDEVPFFQTELSGDGKSVAIGVTCLPSTGIGGKVLFYSHDLAGNLSYSSSIEFPIPGNGQRDVKLSYDGTLVLISLNGYHPNYGAFKIKLYQRSSSTSSDWVELETPQGLDLEGRRHIMSFSTANSRASYAYLSNDFGLALSDTGKGMATQESVYWFPRYKDGHTGEYLFKPGFYKQADNTQRIKIHLKPST